MLINFFNQEEKTVKIIEKILPAIVSISVSQKIDKIEKEAPQFVFPVFEKDKKKSDIMTKKIDGKKISISGGSGFIIDPSGIIVTNIHVISGKDFLYEILFSNGHRQTAKLIGTDAINDVAFLKINNNRTFPYIILGDSSKVKLGQSVLAIGNALGMFYNTVSKGIVSGLSRCINAENENINESLRGLIQTDAAINPGNSGGPLINLKGEAIGINSANVAKAENIGFALPINIIKKDLNQLLSTGLIKKPFLGIRYLIIDHSIQDLIKSPISNGAYVVSPSPSLDAIVKNSPADKAKIQEKDIIIEINGKKLNINYTLQDFLEEAETGQRVKIKIVRKGKTIITETTLTES